MNPWLLAVLLTAQDLPIPIPQPLPSRAGVVIDTVPVPPAAAAATPAPPEVRIQDLVEVDGVRRNQLFGTGIVVGLNSTGDSSIATKKAIANFVKRTNLNVTPAEVSSGNVALVAVTATLEPFAAAGTAGDAHVQSIGDAKSLFGGQLLQTPLYGADGLVYMVAQGSVSVGGFAVGGQAGSVTQNHPLVGIVMGGALVEREVPMKMTSGEGIMHLHLRAPNYQTAARIAARLNQAYPRSAHPLNNTTIRLQVPELDRKDVVSFFSRIGELSVSPGEEAVVVINERTGTIVAGNQVRISAAAITHGNLTITIAESPEVSQPAPFSEGETTVVPRTDLSATVEDRDLVLVKGGTSVSELAAALNALGVSSRDLVSIFEALKRGGHLHARLEVL